jgi:hypothetical protein
VALSQQRKESHYALAAVGTSDRRLEPAHGLLAVTALDAWPI